MSEPGHGQPLEGAFTASELFSRLSVLLECMQNDGGGGRDDSHMLNEAAERVLSAAVNVEEQVALLSDQVGRLQKLVVTDELTGLLNRRGFESQLERTLALARRHEESGMLVYVDLDGFKAINDTWGHAVGDEVLRHAATVLVNNIRSTDIIARLGGDEFAIVLTRSSAVGGSSRVCVLETLLNEAALSFKGHIILIAASFGAVAYGPGDTREDVLARADAKMYERKRQRQINRERKIA